MTPLQLSHALSFSELIQTGSSVWPYTPGKKARCLSLPVPISLFLLSPPLSPLSLCYLKEAFKYQIRKKP